MTYRIYNTTHSLTGRLVIETPSVAAAVSELRDHGRVGDNYTIREVRMEQGRLIELDAHKYVVRSATPEVDEAAQSKPQLVPPPAKRLQRPMMAA